MANFWHLFWLRCDHEVDKEKPPQILLYSFKISLMLCCETQALFFPSVQDKNIMIQTRISLSTYERGIRLNITSCCVLFRLHSCSLFIATWQYKVTLYMYPLIFLYSLISTVTLVLAKIAPHFSLSLWMSMSVCVCLSLNLSICLAVRPFLASLFLPHFLPLSRAASALFLLNEMWGS